MSILVSILFRSAVLYHVGSIGKSIKIIELKELPVSGCWWLQWLCRRLNGQWFESRFLSIKVKPLKENTHLSERTIPLKGICPRIILLVRQFPEKRFHQAGNKSFAIPNITHSDYTDPGTYWWNYSINCLQRRILPFLWKGGFHDLSVEALGGSIAKWSAYLLLDPAALGLIPSISGIFSEEKIVDVAEVIQRCC